MRGRVGRRAGPALSDWGEARSQPQEHRGVGLSTIVSRWDVRQSGVRSRGQVAYTPRRAGMVQNACRRVLRCAWKSRDGERLDGAQWGAIVPNCACSGTGCPRLPGAVRLALSRFLTFRRAVLVGKGRILQTGHLQGFPRFRLRPARGRLAWLWGREQLRHARTGNAGSGPARS